jgi:hypothetical protein
MQTVLRAWIVRRGVSPLQRALRVGNALLVKRQRLRAVSAHLANRADLAIAKAMKRRRCASLARTAKLAEGPHLPEANVYSASLEENLLQRAASAQRAMLVRAPMRSFLRVWIVLRGASPQQEVLCAKNVPLAKRQRSQAVSARIAMPAHSANVSRTKECAASATCATQAKGQRQGVQNV